MLTHLYDLVQVYNEHVLFLETVTKAWKLNFVAQLGLKRLQICFLTFVNSTLQNWVLMMSLSHVDPVL